MIISNNWQNGKPKSKLQIKKSNYRRNNQRLDEQSRGQTAGKLLEEDNDMLNCSNDCKSNDDELFMADRNSTFHENIKYGKINGNHTTLILGWTVYTLERRMYMNLQCLKLLHWICTSITFTNQHMTINRLTGTKLNICNLLQYICIKNIQDSIIISTKCRLLFRK